ncbi:McrC family protein [uncultured Ruminococcus sp.]|uniref:McrC family protein n=1 Tax=uncultured Ruminococcus sp. TaxID=165186 RepID=UPI00260210A4|nr:McrC family protein [uncultured Ruminococcus sp.]
MKELLELKEFDTIICNPDYKDQYRWMDKNSFAELIEFIHAFDSDDVESDILDFIKVGYKRNLGETVTFKNYVGLIQIKNKYMIQILPKIEFINGEKDETKQVFMKMLRSMKDFPSKVFTKANLKTEQMNLYEIFINMYLQEVRTLVKHGIKSSYTSQEDNLHFYKGKLLVNEHLKANLAHKERFYVCFDEYQVNRPENRLIKSMLLKLQKLSSSAENGKEIRQLLTSFELVEPSKNYDEDFAKVVIDRNTKDYEMLMKWSKVFLKNKSFTTFSGTDSAKALLFPMEKVFESYVARQLKKSLLGLNWDVSCQDKGFYLFDSPKQFALRPDIVITKEDGSKVILDTKWKRLIDNTKINYGISQADMYQMYAYSKKYGTSKIWLLYPITQELKDKVTISFNSNDGVTVTVFFVDVADIENNFMTLRRLLLET